MRKRPTKTTPTEELSPSDIDAVFKVLSHSFRRAALECLREHRTIPLDDLAEAVAARVYQQPREELEEENVERVFRSLYHTHVPKLVSARMVDFDQSEATVSIRDAASRADPFLSLAKQQTKNR